MRSLYDYKLLYHTGLRNNASYTAIALALFVAAHVKSKKDKDQNLQKSFLVFGICFIVVALLLRILLIRDFPPEVRSKMRLWFFLMNLIGFIEILLIIQAMHTLILLH